MPCLSDLPTELLCNVLEYVSIENLHCRLRYVNRELNTMVDEVLSRDHSIRYINRRYGILWTFGGYAINPLWSASISHFIENNGLKIATIFQKAREDRDSSIPICQNVQLFFRWSVHTVSSIRVYFVPSDKRSDKMISYIGVVDYRRLLNWIVYINGEDENGHGLSRWLIPI